MHRPSSVMLSTGRADGIEKAPCALQSKSFFEFFESRIKVSPSRRCSGCAQGLEGVRCNLNHWLRNLQNTTEGIKLTYTFGWFIYNFDKP